MIAVLRAPLVAVVLMALSACSNGPAECVAAGGKCVLGDGPCQGTEGPQDCDPAPVNPAGDFCCLPCPAGQTANDAGMPFTGCH